MAKFPLIAAFDIFLFWPQVVKVMEDRNAGITMVLHGFFEMRWMSLF